MLKFISVAIFLLMFATIAHAQNSELAGCPAIAITGPPGVIIPGEVASWTLAIRAEPKLDLTIRWTASSGKIIEGQGTETIKVKFAPETITVTAEVTGLPGHCPSKFSETGFWHPPLNPIRLFELQPNAPISNGEIAALYSEHKENPNNQIYILVGYLYGKPSMEIHRKEVSVRTSLWKAGIPPAQITFKSVYAEAELMQFWRVPPGAINPTCEACEKFEKEIKSLNCPEVSVAGPLGVTASGGEAVFNATVGPSDARIDYKLDWTVMHGKIVRGQGTKTLVVSSEERGISIVATVTVNGLPERCPKTAFDTYFIEMDFEPKLLREFPTTRSVISKQVAAEIKKVTDESPNSQLYVGLKFSIGTSSKAMSQAKNQLVQQLVNSGIDRSRITVIHNAKGGNATILWLVGPGQHNPTLH